MIFRKFELNLSFFGNDFSACLNINISCKNYSHTITPYWIKDIGIIRKR